MAKKLAAENEEEKEARRAKARMCTAQERAKCTDDETAARQEKERTRIAQAREKRHTELEERAEDIRRQAHALRSASGYPKPPTFERLDEILRDFQGELDEQVRACTVCDHFCYLPVARFVPLDELLVTPGVTPLTYVRSLHNYCVAPNGVAAADAAADPASDSSASAAAAADASVDVASDTAATAAAAAADAASDSSACAAAAADSCVDPASNARAAGTAADADDAFDAGAAGAAAQASSEEELTDDEEDAEKT